MRQSERDFSHDLTSGNAVLVRAKERQKLLRLARVLDNPIELGPAFAGAPHQTQREAAPGGEGEARAHPDSFGTKG
jgi:hypothetical protein